MAEPRSGDWQRREFLRAGAASTAGFAALSKVALASRPGDDPPAEARSDLPTRTLGKTGAKVTVLNQGTVGQPESLDRLLRYAYQKGVRYFDTAEGYKNAEKVFKDWFEAMPHVRKEIFLATKSGVGKPSDMIAKLDQRLERLGVDQIDLLFFHGLGSGQVDWPKGKEMKEAAEALKKTGKVRFVGFSTHDRLIAEQIKNAAEGGFVDVIMLQFNPWLDRDSALNKALDAAHKANIGLVSMKQINGQAQKVTADKVPSLKERKLSPVQGLLHAIWSDERFSSACVTMRNFDQTNENVDAARRFEPLKAAELKELREAVLAAGPTLCPNCDGRCSLAAGTRAILKDLSLIYTYHEENGMRGHARACHAELTAEQKDWEGADLVAAREACQQARFRLDPPRSIA
ncbi:MAG: aldo/keto reductase [Isosphaeraceae bacterium]